MTDDGKLLCVARGSGKVRWLQQLARFRIETEKKKKDPIRWTGPILAGGRLIAVNSEGTLAEYSPTDGSLLASTEFDSSLSQSPIVANNILYILSDDGKITARSEEHTSELQSLMRISYAVFCLKKKKT